MLYIENLEEEKQKFLIMLNKEIGDINKHHRRLTVIEKY